MKTIGVIPNADKDSGFVFTKNIIEWIKSKGHNPLISSHISRLIGAGSTGCTIKDIYLNAELLLVLGGDGTILKVAKHAAINNIPILGINLGSLGYLTDIDRNDWAVSLEKYLNGDFTIENRMMLEANTLSSDTENDELVALNDVCISSGFFRNMISIELFVNDEYIDFYKADGIIISTPTGSTAYNLSAGGPILKPDSKMIAITPICPHMLYSRPFVISSDDKIKIKIGNRVSNDTILSLDGQNIIPVKNGDIVYIKTSVLKTQIVKTNKMGFYDILRRKMVPAGGNSIL
ncbi:MAG: NAD(+)/NADH kinase [Clostridiales bacterium]|jgi:NAD+ kinase|nr:NAD(+)/NADH kinase [Clostridiales bacterium]